MIRLLPPALLMVAITGCSTESNLESDDFTGTPPITQLAVNGQFRIDVFPPTDQFTGTAGRPVILPQTYDVYIEDQVELTMAPAVQMSGIVLGWGVTPYRGPDLPGSEIAVHAEVHVQQRNSVQGRLAYSQPEPIADSDGNTAPNGSYTLTVSAGDAYTVSVIPDDGNIPFVVDAIALLGDTIHNVNLGYGTAVWGTVTQSDGQPIAGVRVLAELADGTRGNPVLTNEVGRYELRVQPELEYRIVALGRDNGGRDPIVSTAPNLVTEIGLDQDIEYGTLEPFRTVAGTVTGPTGSINDAVVRLTSLTLDGYADDASLIAEDETTSSGQFALQVVPGTYSVEVMLRSSSAAYSPVRLDDIVVSGTVQLGSIPLSGFTDRNGLVVDDQGSSVADALITARETGFSRRSWTTTSDDDGNWVMPLPNTNLEYIVTPPHTRSDLAMTVTAPVDRDGDGGRDLILTSGSTFQGTVVWDDNAETRGIGLAVIEVRDENGELWGQALTDADGKFSVQVAWTPAR